MIVLTHILDSLREVAETTLAEAMRKAQASRRRDGLAIAYSVNDDRHVLERIAQVDLGDRGFSGIHVTMSPTHYEYEIWAQHRCGAWSKATVTGRWLKETGEGRAELVLGALDRVRCFCVQREEHGKEMLR